MSSEFSPGVLIQSHDGIRMTTEFATYLTLVLAGKRSLLWRVDFTIWHYDSKRERGEETET